MPKRKIRRFCVRLGRLAHFKNGRCLHCGKRAERKRSRDK